MSRPEPAAPAERAGGDGDGARACPSPPDAGRRRRAARLRWWPAIAYPVAFLACSLAVQAQPVATRSAALLWASTNLDNLADHPLRALAASALLAGENAAAWTALAVLGLAGLVAAAGPFRAVAVAAAAHLLGTATSEGALAVRIGRGLEPASQRTILDVGPSFVVVGVLVATVVCGAGAWWRLAAAAGFALLAPSLFAGLTSWDVASLGHLTAVVVGLGAGALVTFRRHAGAVPAASATASGSAV